MHKKHSPQRPDGFAKYRERHYRGARHTLLLLPPAKRRALQRNLIFIGTEMPLALAWQTSSEVSSPPGRAMITSGRLSAPTTS